MRDCERALLAALMYEPADLTAIAGLVQPDSFSSFEGQALFLGLRSTSSFHGLVDWLAARGLLARVDGQAHLDTLLDVVPGPANIRRWVELVRDPTQS